MATDLPTPDEPVLPLSVVRALVDNYTAEGVRIWLDSWEQGGCPPARIVESAAGSTPWMGEPDDLLPTPDALRARIEAERDWARQVLLDPITGRATPFPRKRAERILARCDSALSRLDRHGKNHFCLPMEADQSPAWRVYTSGDPRFAQPTDPAYCWEYERLASEYPDPAT